MKDTLHYLDMIEIHDPDFDCDIDGDSDDLLLLIKTYLQHLNQDLQLTMRTLTTGCHQAMTGQHQYMGIFALTFWHSLIN